MQHQTPTGPSPPQPIRLLRVPLFRLLAINLCIGAAAAALLVGGLLWLDPGGLRELLFADRSPAIAIGVLLASFFITFGSVAMGTAIMALGRSERKDGSGGGCTRHLALKRLMSRRR